MPIQVLDPKVIMLEQLITPPEAGSNQLKIDNYHAQLLGFQYLLEAVLNDQPLSIELICQLHLINTFPQYKYDISQYHKEYDYVAPELKPPLPAKPGHIRNDIVGTTIEFRLDRDKYTLTGIGEILQMIRDEGNQRPKLPKYHGTWFGSELAMSGKAPIDEINRHDTISSLESGNSKTEYAQKVLDSIKKQPHVILFYRTDSHSNNLQQELTKKINTYIESVNRDMQLAVDDKGKIKLIVDFIKKCLRVHPLFDANHRVFVKDILNYLLLKHNLGLSLLEDRRQFIFIGTDESEKSVIDSILSADKKQLCKKLLEEIQEAIKTHIKDPDKFTLEKILGSDYVPYKLTTPSEEGSSIQQLPVVEKGILQTADPKLMVPGSHQAVSTFLSDSNKVIEQNYSSTSSLLFALKHPDMLSVGVGLLVGLAVVLSVVSCGALAAIGGGLALAGIASGSGIFAGGVTFFVVANKKGESLNAAEDIPELAI